MRIFIEETYELMCRDALEKIVEMTTQNKHPLLCTASGDTPAGLYKQLVNDVNQNKIDVSDWLYISLDEWMGMNGNDEGSCRFHLNNQLFVPLKVRDEQISFFDGKAKDPIDECEKVENYINENGGIDIAIVGLGMNGHVGMNEPGTQRQLRSHVTEIHKETQKVGQKYFKEKQQLTQGITLGLANILDARNIILLASGQHKAAIVKQVLQGEISNKFPASFLRNHPALHIYLDKEAASLLQPENIK